MKKLVEDISKDILIDIVNKSISFVDVITKLGYPNKLSIKRNIERQIYRYNISVEHFESIQRCKKDRYNKEKLLELIDKCSTMKEILFELNVNAIHSNYKLLKKYFTKYNIDYSKYLCNDKVKNHSEIYNQKYFEIIIKESICIADVCRKLNLNSHGNNFKTIKKYIELYNIDISHFNPDESRRKNLERLRIKNTIKINDILVENSTYSTIHLKERLYKEGLKERKCEKCGQGEEWNGEHMSLILDHINGINDDHRLKNLRIVCPNCNATLETHCRGFKKLQKIKEREKNKIEQNIIFKEIKLNNKEIKNKKCNICGSILKTKRSNICQICSKKQRRKVERPPYEQLLEELKNSNYTQIGKKYGVSDNAIRKWLKIYKKGI